MKVLKKCTLKNMSADFAGCKVPRFGGLGGKDKNKKRVTRQYIAVG
jgi:hypothetical protein